MGRAKYSLNELPALTWPSNLGLVMLRLRRAELPLYVFWILQPGAMHVARHKFWRE